MSGPGGPAMPIPQASRPSHVTYRDGSFCDATSRKRLVSGRSPPPLGQDVLRCYILQTPRSPSLLDPPGQIVLRCHIMQTIHPPETTCFTKSGSANGLLSTHRRTLIMSLCGPL